MKTPFKNPVNSFAPVFLMLMAMFLLGFGCNTSKPTPDLLAGFHFSDLVNLQNNKAISDDYNAYINNLPPKLRNGVGPMQYFEDGTGQHAVLIAIAQDGTDWAHVLIYDKE